MGSSLMLTGDIAEGRAYYDQAIALYDPAAHRSLTTRFGQDLGVSNFVFRSQALWLRRKPMLIAIRGSSQVSNLEAYGRF